MKSIRKTALLKVLSAVILLAAGSLADASPQFQIHPLCFLKTPLGIPQNLPVLLILSSSCPGKYSSAEMTLETPEFILLKEFSSRYPDPATGKVIRQAPEHSVVMRDSRRCNRYRIKFDPRFISLIGHIWNYQHLLLSAAPDSGGRKGRMYWSFKVDGNDLKEMSAEVAVLPAVRFPSRPAEKFKLHLSYPGTNAVIPDYWKSLSKCRERLVYPGDRPDGVFEDTVMLGGDMLCMYPETRKALAELRRAYGISEPNGPIPNWRKLEDSDRKFENYLRFVFRTIRDKKPEMKTVIWDFEPGAKNFEEGERKRFAQQMKWNSIPSAAEIETKYWKQWFAYTLDRHTQLIRKVCRIFREELPGRRFHLCTDPLHAGRERLSHWCCVDPAAVDDVVDGHCLMPYYTGVKFFDDVRFNLENLKKDVFIWIDPAERLLSFFQQYTPEKVRQNILAAAALGAKGFGFWPNEAFGGEYFQVIASAFEEIAEYEDFYRKGKRADGKFRFTPLNAASHEITGEDGRKISMTFPDFSRVIRTTVHRHQGKYLFTILNCHPKEAAILEISGEKIRYALKVPPNGAVLSTPDNPPPQEAIRREIEKNRMKQGGNTLFREIRAGDSVVYWSAAGGKSVLKAEKRHLKIQIDALENGEVTGFRNRTDAELMKGGYAGKILLLDPGQEPCSFRPLPNRPGCIRSQATVPPFPDANPAPNPLLNLRIDRSFLLQDSSLKVRIKFTNPTEQTMRFSFRAANLPKPGTRFHAEKTTLSLGTLRNTDNIFLKKGAEVNFLNHVERKLWDGAPVISRAAEEYLEDTLTFTPDPKFAGVYCWQRGGDVTIEFLSPEIVLSPGRSETYEYTIK